MRPPFPLRFLLFGLFGLARTAAAQDIPVYPPPAPYDSTGLGRTDAQTFANSQVVGMGPSKGLIVKYERIPGNFSLKSTLVGDLTSVTPRIPDYNTTVSKNANLVIKAYAPLLNHPHLKLVLGLNYDRQEFQFQEPAASAPYSLYGNIENKALTIIGTQLAVIRPVDAVHWYIFRTKGELNGDYASNELNVTDYLKVTSEFIYGWKRSPTFAWGIGVQLGYNLGRQSIYPVIVYNRTFNPRWGVEALFPARVLLRRNLSPTSLLFAGYEVASNNYNIKLRNTFATPNNPTVRSLELRQIDLKFRLRYEHELLSFLWTGIEAGYRYNYQFNAFDRTNSTRDRIINSQFGSTPYASLDLFIVPPKKLLQKAERNRK
ncbi:DUF6268 family outer membrane beta-barrel protein [Hymenobacter convexus]|uniref:DUF6268 family outer membrane beta-barrel protein n=1 Tax=Hymenobacter sp. CA1UV-4 TaxID=3063782 RepID=UPI002712D07B|nr:DUF6268 family outer membrane beta-barrel protein [Hymenobacter sp. CA1UV-4]MDO7854675.1 DUF6268 family outer membrane beta-barrel protein [Hymenobacter sp. CA1UV-4]